MGDIIGIIHLIFTLCSNHNNTKAQMNTFLEHYLYNKFKCANILPTFVKDIAKSQELSLETKLPSEISFSNNGKILFHLCYNPGDPP